MREPMLAVAVKKLPIRFPVVASPKLDGVRVWAPEDELLSRKMKRFPNVELNETFGMHWIGSRIDAHLRGNL